jgi:hypothetical protein
LVDGFFEQNILEEDGIKKQIFFFFLFFPRSRKPERVFASERKE